jgi:uncharacterized protein (TIGR04255 family)
MAFPDSNREIYGRNPLAEVVAELRFQPILKIEADIPAQFQEAIRDRYSVYRREVPAGQLPANVPPPIRNLIEGMGAAAGPVQHFFGTHDQKGETAAWTVTLSREAIALKTIAYTRWEEFLEQLDRVREAFEEIYKPPSYTRLGLRYVDVIHRSKLELGGVAWGELLNEAIAGEFSAPEFGEHIDSAQRQLHCRLEGDDCFLTMRTGLALAEQAMRGAAKEKCFLIDCDFHTHGTTEIGNVTTVLNRFNRASGNLFRWAIRHRLRDALQPQPLGR